MTCLSPRGALCLFIYLFFSPVSFFFYLLWSLLFEVLHRDDECSLAHGNVSLEIGWKSSRTFEASHGSSDSIQSQLPPDGRVCSECFSVCLRFLFNLRCCYVAVTSATWPLTLNLWWEALWKYAPSYLQVTHVWGKSQIQHDLACAELGTLPLIL